MRVSTSAQRLSGADHLSEQKTPGYIWEGQLEPAVSVWIEGGQGQDAQMTQLEVREFAASLGSKYNQDAVLLFTPDEDANRILYTLRGIQEGDMAIAKMQEYGIPSGRLSEDTLEIIDVCGSHEQAVMALAVALNANWDFVYGHAQIMRREDYGSQP